MKFKHIIPITLMSTLIFTGCSSDDETTTTEITTKASDMKITENIIETTTISIPTTIETTIITTEEPKQTLVVTPIYQDIFLKLADGIGTTLFEEVKQIAEKSSYKYDITEPTENDLGIINIYGNNNDYIYISFYPKNDIEILSCIEYIKDSKSISISDEYHTTNPKYKTHIDNQGNKDVSNPKELEEFMFSE